MKDQYIFTLTLALCVLTLVSCRRPGLPSERHVDVVEADSLVFEQMTGDNSLAFAAVDSLLGIGAISETRATYYRAHIHFKMGHTLNAELLYKRVLAGDELLQEQPTAAYYAYDQLATILNIKGDTQGALEYATKGYTITSKDSSHKGVSWQAVLLHDIGYGQMMLGRTDEAERNFNQAYKTLERLAEDTNDYDCVYAWARVSFNIMDAYVCAERFDDALRWVSAAEVAINTLIKRRDCPERTSSEYLGSFCTHKAIVMRKTGHNDEADNAYRAFLLSDYSKTDIGLVDNAEYLDIIGNWKERARLTPRLDSLVQAWNMPKSMYYLRTYLVPFFNAYVRSDQPEKALAMAQRIADEVDSIAEYERIYNATELSIIYETQEKEAHIAEQDARLNGQRFLATAVIFVLVTVFLVIYTVMHRRVAMRLKQNNAMLAATNTKLKEANERAQESSRMKSEFIRQISHEIRTPLNILSGFTQVITTPDMELDDDTRKDINRQITDNTNRITGLVDKMLELSEANSRTVIQRTANISPMEIAAEAAEASGVMTAEDVTFDLRIAPEAEDITLTTNRKAAARALTLLLDNARKFATPHVAAAAADAQDATAHIVLAVDIEGDSVHFAVEDNGPGVPAKDAERIFEEFVQLDSFADGTGIGLTVARSLAQRLGGGITLDTSYTHGARFVMVLPL